jgi:hypothetical protein
LVKFIQQRGYEIPSPAILGKMTDEYKAAVEAFAKEQGIDLIHFERGVRKDGLAAAYRERQGEKEGVLFIGIAQERAYAYKAHKRVQGKLVGFDYSRQSVFVNHYYFYLEDEDFGPAFIKVCSYAPYAVKICLNGHEWAKRQLLQRGMGFEALDNMSDVELVKEILRLSGPRRVRVIVLYPLSDEWDEAEWLQAAARNPAFAFLSDPEGDIYSLADGKPFHDEV